MRRLLIFGLVGGFAIFLIWRLFGHDSAEAVQMYPSIDACKAERSVDECEQAFSGAQAQHESTAPHYTTQASCEDLYGPGQCVPRGSQGGSGGWFIPAMAGFMLGHALGSHPIYQPVYVTSAGYAYSAGAPLGLFHRGCDGWGGSCGGYSSSSFTYISRTSSFGGGSTFWSSGSYTTHTATVSRSGFGSSSSISKPFSGSSSSSIASSSSSVTRGGFGSSAAHAASSSGS